MNSQEFGQFFATKGIEMFDQLGCGVIDRYPLSVQLVGKPSLITSLIVKIHLAAALKKNHRKELKNLTRHNASISYVGRTLQIILRTGHMQYPYECSQTLISVINYLSNNNIQESNQCPICNQFGPDGLAYYGGVYQKVHLHCIQNLLDEKEAAVQKNETNGNLATGLIGAILGGIIGIIPSVLTGVYADSIYALLFALIPLCIFYGYKLFQGRMDNSAIVLTIVLSILFLFLMRYVMFVFVIHKEFGLWLFKDCLKVFFDKEYFGEMIRSMGMSFVFLGLGIIYSWGMISQSNKKTTTSVAFTRATVRPMVDSGYVPYKNEKQQ